MSVGFSSYPINPVLYEATQTLHVTFFNRIFDLNYKISYTLNVSESEKNTLLRSLAQPVNAISLPIVKKKLVPNIKKTPHNVHSLPLLPVLLLHFQCFRKV